MGALGSSKTGTMRRGNEDTEHTGQGREHCVRTQQEGNHQQAKERGNQPSTLIMDF
jgi:hypothetical protein